jgi:DNA mismatch endonuclease Vsr
MDTITPAQRHLNMSHIRSTNSQPETAVRSALHKLGFRFRKNDRRLAGKPDIVFPHYHAVIFVNGCFWHAHARCAKFVLSKTNTVFWQEKLTRNVVRDRTEYEMLMQDGWRVGVVWECAITGKDRGRRIRSTAEKISQWLEEGFDEPYREF